MIIMLYMLLLASAAHGSQNNNPLLYHPLTVIQSAYDDKPLLPTHLENWNSHYFTLKKSLFSTESIGLYNKLLGKKFRYKRSKHKNRIGKPLYKQVLLKNFIHEVLHKIHYATLYYAIIYEKPADIFHELGEYNPEISIPLLINISTYIPTSENKPMNFYMDNYQTKFDRIVEDYHENNRSKSTGNEELKTTYMI